MEPDTRQPRPQNDTAPTRPATEAPVDPFWAIGVGLVVLFAVGAAALAAG